MSTAPAAKVVQPGQGRSVTLFAVGFDDKVTSADSGGALAALEVTIPPRTLVKPHNHTREDEYTVVLAGTVGLEDYFVEMAPVVRDKAPPVTYDALAARYGLTIQNDWIEDLVRTFGVKL
jgi:hypothetical protein